MRAADPLLFLLSALAVTLTFPARAMRARWLLTAAVGHHPPFRPVWLATAIGFMANNLLPLRAGEVARAYATGRLVRLPVSTALSTLAVERVFDGIVILLMLAVGIAASDFGDSAQVQAITSFATFVAIVFVAGLVVLAVLAHRPPRLIGLAHGLINRLPPRLADKATALFDNLVGGLSVLRRPRDFTWVLAWSLVVWGLNAGSYLIAFRAFGLDALPPSAALVLQGIVALGVAVPSTPGFVGVFEAACKATLLLYGITESVAVGFALALHLGWFIPITTLGLIALAQAGLSFRDIREERAA